MPPRGVCRSVTFAYCIETAEDTAGHTVTLSLCDYVSVVFVFVFSAGQTAIKLPGAEAADQAQCAAPD